MAYERRKIKQIYKEYNIMNINLTSKQIIRLSFESNLSAKDYRMAIDMSTDKKEIAKFKISLREIEETINALEKALL